MPNLHPDGDFELGLSYVSGGWSYLPFAGRSQSYGAHNGVWSGGAMGLNWWPGYPLPPVWYEGEAYTELTVTAGEELRITLWAEMYAPTSVGSFEVLVYDYGNAHTTTLVHIPHTEATGEWQLLEALYTPVGAKIRLRLRVTDPFYRTGIHWIFDEVDVRPSVFATSDPGFELDTGWVFAAGATRDSRSLGGSAAALLPLATGRTGLVIGHAQTAPGTTQYIGCHAMRESGAAAVALIVENPWPGGTPETIAVSSRGTSFWQALGGPVQALGDEVRVWISAADVGEGDGAWLVDDFRIELLAHGGQEGGMALSKTQIVNMALARIGATERVANVETDQTQAAEEANLIYDQVLEEVLAAAEWNFATLRIALADLGSPPAEWEYRYAYPADCLKALYIPDGFQSRRPEDRIAWQVEAGDDGRVILTDQPQAELVYIARVTDTGRFSPRFITALTWRLAEELAMPLTREGRLQDLARANYQKALAAAAATDMNEGQQPADPTPSIIAARR